MNTVILQNIRDYKSIDAFWNAASCLQTDREAQTLFLRIVNQKANMCFLREQEDKIRQLADAGNPYMQYAFARIHDFFVPQEDSVELCEKYYQQAYEGGVTDSLVCLAQFYRDGDLGEVDMRRFHDYLKKALDEGSVFAAKQQLRAMIYGNAGFEADPARVCTLIERYLAEPSPLPADPYFHFLWGLAEKELGHKAEALSHYQEAADQGVGEAFGQLAMDSCTDDNYVVQDRDRFVELMERAQEVGDGFGFLDGMLLVDEDIYDGFDDSQKPELTSMLNEQLRLAWEMGEPLGAYFLAQNYEEGCYGFERDAAKAFKWYSGGAILRNTDCYNAIVRMILDDHTAPERYSEEFAYEAAYRSLMLGGDMLARVIEGYRKGFLTHHAAMIESTYLPQYEEQREMGLQPDDDAPANADDDEDDDDLLAVGNLPDDLPADYTLQQGTDYCLALADAAEALMQDQRAPWEVTACVRKYLSVANRLKGYSHLIHQLYSLNKRMLNVLSDHPRLRLQLCAIQLEVLHDIEQESGHSLGITEDMQAEFEQLSRAIWLADHDMLETIPQTGHLKRDPVEWTKQWEDVIDEADRIAYSHLRDVPRGMGFCFAFWQERAAALRSLGVEWRNPHLMNPSVHFD